MTEICQTLLMVSVASVQGRILEGRMSGMHLPTSHFQKCFDVYIFSMTWNLFDGKMHRNRRSTQNQGQKIKQKLPEIY